MLKKLVSLTTALAFLSSFIVAPSVQGAVEYAEGTRYAAQARAALDRSLPAFGIDISPANGRVTDVRDFGAGPLVINIQDLHCHPEVQRNIAALLSQIERSHGAGRSVQVFVEGGYGTVDTSWISALKDPALRASLMAALVESGHLTGAELYAMQSNRPTMLAGLEDEALHKGNIVRLGKILENKPRYEQSLTTLRRELTVMQARHFSSRNKRLTRIIERYRAGDLPPAAYYTLLGKYVEKIGAHPRQYNNTFSISHDQYPNIALLRSMAALSKGMNFRLVSTQMQKLMQSLRGVMSFADYNALVDQTQNFKDMDRLYLSLASALSGPESTAPWVAGARRELARYRELQSFFSYVLMKQNLNPVRLVREERVLVEQLRSAFSRSTPELEVAFLTDFFDCYSGYLLNRLSADDYRYFASRFEKFQSVWGKYTFENRIKGLADDYPLLNEYYAVNARRNAVFLRTIDAFLAPGGDRVAVIVSGGFHTEGMAALLAGRKISSATITPGVTQDTHGAEAAYVRRALEQSRLFGAQALQLVLGSFGAKVQNVTDQTIELVIGNRSLTIERDGNVVKPLTPEAAQVLRDAGAPASAEVLNAALQGTLALLSTLSGPTLLSVAEMIMNLGQSVIKSGSTLGWWGEEGLIWKIANDTAVQNMLAQSDYDLNEIAEFPAFLQNAIQEKVRNHDGLISRAQGTPPIAALLAIPSVLTLISPLLTDRGNVTYADRLATLRGLPMFTRLGNINTPAIPGVNEMIEAAYTAFKAQNPTATDEDFVKYLLTIDEPTLREAGTTRKPSALPEAARPSGVTPSTQELGKRWGWPQWAIKDILAPVKELFRILLQPRKFGALHTKYTEPQQTTLTILAWGTAITAALAGISMGITAALSTSTVLAGAGAGILTWLATGVIIHALWNIFSTLPATMGGNVEPQAGPMLQVNALAFGAHLDERGNLVPGTAKQLKEALPGWLEAGYREIYLVGLLQRGELAARLAQGDRPAGSKDHIGYYSGGEKRIVVRTPWQGIEADLGVANPDPAHAKTYISASSFASKYGVGVDDEWGTLEDLLEIRDTAASVGGKVIVDVVPNHIGPDNPWLDGTSIVDGKEVPNWQAMVHIDLQSIFSAEDLKELTDDELLDLNKLRMKSNSRASEGHPSMQQGDYQLRNSLWKLGMETDVLGMADDFGHKGRPRYAVYYTRPGDPASRVLIAYGKDTWDGTDPWIDTLQLDFTHPAARAFVLNNIEFWAQRGIGVRMDMAYLLMRKWFAHTWYSKLSAEEQEKAFKEWKDEFWDKDVVRILEKYPDFTNTMETYQDHGYFLELHPRVRMYQKEEFYDNLNGVNIQGLKSYLRKWSDHLNSSSEEERDWAVAQLPKLVHFIQNHDDGDLMAKGPEFMKVAKLLMMTMFGQPMVHEEETRGIARHNIQVIRAAGIPNPSIPNPEMKKFSDAMASAAVDPLYRTGDFRFIETGDSNLIAFQRRDQSGRRTVVVLNLSDNRSEARISLPDIAIPKNGRVRLVDAYYAWKTPENRNGQQPVYLRSAEELKDLYISLGPRDAHLFHVDEIGTYDQIADYSAWRGYLREHGLLAKLDQLSEEKKLIAQRYITAMLPVWNAVKAAPDRYTLLMPHQQAMLDAGLQLVNIIDPDEMWAAYIRLVNIWRLRAPPAEVPEGILMGLLPRNFENEDQILEFIENHPAVDTVWMIGANQGTPYQLDDHLAAYTPNFSRIVDRVHHIGRRVMVDVVLNHFGLANALLDQKPSLFESRELTSAEKFVDERRTIDSVWAELTLEQDAEIRDAARMTLNTLHMLSDQISWVDMFNPYSPILANEVKKLIVANNPEYDDKKQKRVYNLVQKVLVPFLTVDGKIAQTQKAWDMEKNDLGEPKALYFLRIQPDGSPRIFCHGSDKGTGDSRWTNTVQLNWVGNPDGVKNLVIAMMNEWVARYGIDGFRLDAAHHLTRPKRDNDPGTVHILKEIREQIEAANPGRQFEFIVETFVNHDAVKQVGMMPCQIVTDQINPFVTQGVKERLESLLQGDLTDVVAILYRHDDAQTGSTLVEKMGERKTAFAEFLLRILGVRTYRNADQISKKTTAHLMKYNGSERLGWLHDRSAYLEAQERWLEMLSNAHPYMSGHHRYILSAGNPHIFAMAKWHRGDLAICAATPFADSMQRGSISGQQLSDLNNFVPSEVRLDPRGYYRIVDDITGTSYHDGRAVRGEVLLHDGLNIVLSKGGVSEGRIAKEFIARQNESRSPQFQFLRFEKIAESEYAAARAASFLPRIVRVGAELRGYICGRYEETRTLYIALPKQPLPVAGDIDVIFSNGPRARIKRATLDEALSVAGASDVVVVPVNTDCLYMGEDSSPESTFASEQVNMFKSIGAFSRSSVLPSGDADVLVVSGREKPALSLPLNRLTSAHAAEYNRIENGALLFDADDNIVGVVMGTNDDGSYWIEPVADIPRRVVVYPDQVAAHRNDAAILPENEARVTAMARAGASPLAMAAYVSAKEFWSSMKAALFGSDEFVNGHTRKAGARQLVQATERGLAGGFLIGMLISAVLLSGTAVFTAGGLLAALLPAVLGMAVGGAGTNFIAHMLIDHVVVKDLAAAVKQYGSAYLENGDIHLTLLQVTTPPADIERLNPLRLATTEDGPVWGMVRDGQVIVYSNASPAAVTQAIALRLGADGDVRGETKLSDRLKALFLSALQERDSAAQVDVSALEAAISRAVAGSIVRIEADQSGARMRYDENGTVVLSHGMLPKLKAARAIASAEAVATANSLLLYLPVQGNGLITSEMLVGLEGTQVVVDGIDRAKQVQSLALSRKRHIRVFALVGKDEMQAAFDAGLAGCVVKGTGDIFEIMDFASATPRAFNRDSVPANMIKPVSGDLTKIRESLNNARTPCSILDVGALAVAALESRDISDRTQVIVLLGEGVLSLFGVHMYTPRFMRDAAYGIPADQLTAATKAAYLEKMKADVGPDRFTALEKAFTAAWTEREKVDALVAQLAEKHKYRLEIPLHHRQMLGRALTLAGPDFAMVTSSPDESLALTEAAILQQSHAVEQAVKDGTLPQAITDLITMIELFDAQFPTLESQLLQPNDVRALTAILSAA